MATKTERKTELIAEVIVKLAEYRNTFINVGNLSEEERKISERADNLGEEVENQLRI